ncbi:MAG: hypothetical protein WCG93_06395 [Paludibacter sp.]
MEKIFNLNLDNVLPTHDLTEFETDFSDYYISLFGIQTDERVDVPILLLCPHTFANLITDIIREYDSFNSETVDIELE